VCFIRYWLPLEKERRRESSVIGHMTRKNSDGGGRTDPAGRQFGPLRLTPFFDFPEILPLHPVFLTVEVTFMNVHCKHTIYQYVTAGGARPPSPQSNNSMHIIFELSKYRVRSVVICSTTREFPFEQTLVLHSSLNLLRLYHLLSRRLCRPNLRILIRRHPILL